MEMAKPLSKSAVTSGEVALMRYDSDGESYVVFQEPRRYEQEEVDRLQLSSEISWSTEERGTVSQKDRVPLSALESYMVCLCLVGSNIPDDDDKLIFNPGKTCREPGKVLTEAAKKGFYRVWNALPGDLADEIAEKLVEFYPPFDWRGDRGEE